MVIGSFRAGIAALIWDPDRGAYLMLKRAAEKDFSPGAWECVTGRLDQGEGFESALHREVREEVGLAVQPDFIIGTTHFYRGPRDRANELVGVVYHCSPICAPVVRLSPEHQAVRWATADEAKVFLRDDHPSERWLLRVIRRAEVLRKAVPGDLITYHHESGFELG